LFGVASDFNIKLPTKGNDMNRLYNLFVACYENSIDAFIPEQWANESIALLTERMVAANLVHRDFEPLFAKYGDVVNTRQPADLEAYRKNNSDDVTVQDVSATNVPVPLDQHIHTSFLIRDGEETRSFKSLVDEYLRPAAIALARKIDRVVLGQYAQFLNNHAGSLGGLTNANAVEYLTYTGEVMDLNLAHEEGRNVVLTPRAKTLFTQNPTFHQADRLGDDGTAMREASLGRKFAFDIWSGQNMRSITPDAGTGLGEVNNAAGYPIGTTVLTVDGFAAGELLPGQWVTINGRPYRVSATGADPAVAMTLEYGLTQAVADNDDITVHGWGEVNNGAGYPVNHAKTIVVDGFAGGETPKVGRIVTFGTTSTRYVIIKTNGTTEIELDRPLVAALADNDDVFLGPTGDFNLAFHRNAMTLAIRPLALPRAGAGAISGLANYNNLSIRTVITYDGNKQGHLVTLDFLAGIKVLDTDLGAVLLT